jgi:hypothetical protein
LRDGIAANFETTDSWKSNRHPAVSQLAAPCAHWQQLLLLDRLFDPWRIAIVDAGRFVLFAR